MQFSEFERLVARHGTDPARWPNPDMAARADVRGWLATERALDAALDAHLEPAPLSANFADRVLAKLPELPTKLRKRSPQRRSPQRRSPHRRPLRRRSLRKAFPIWATPVAAALVAGVFLFGSAPLEALSADQHWLDVAELAGMADLYAWVEG